MDLLQQTLLYIENKRFYTKKERRLIYKNIEKEIDKKLIEFQNRKL
tara:strand:+ start:110 stop:247 length:138 start_codon:yes stop_codon:yes gene_type:complete